MYRNGKSKGRKTNRFGKMAAALCVMALAAVLTAGCGGSEEAKIPDHVDLDLTEMSSTMVYSEVFNLMNEPDDYLGKTIKMKGQFAVYVDKNTGENYYACIIQDATACCAQGIEFETADTGMKYPEDYPEQGDEIEVTGVFEKYDETLDPNYCILRQAIMKTASE